MEVIPVISVAQDSSLPEVEVTMDGASTEDNSPGGGHSALKLSKAQRRRRRRTKSANKLKKSGDPDDAERGEGNAVEQDAMGSATVAKKLEEVALHRKENEKLERVGGHDAVEASPDKEKENEDRNEEKENKGLVLKISSEIPAAQISLIKELGSGSYGIVYSGECYGSPVAIKVPRYQELEQLSQHDLDDLKMELEIMINNRHPNLVMCLGACTEAANFKIVLELLDGDLEQLLVANKNRVRLSLYQRMLLSKQTALGMNWLHSVEPAVIHRDLKLENLLYKKVDTSYTVKISDFGLAVIKPKASVLVGRREGTLTTMAPEIMIGADYDTKADVYSFGIILWQMLTCEQLYKKERYDDGWDTSKLSFAVWRDGLRPTIPGDCMPELSSLMQDCWDKDPTKRPDFLQVSQRLDTILINSAIRCEEGQKFWASAFIKRNEIKWEEFSKALTEWLYPDPANVPSDIGPKLACLQELAGEKGGLSRGMSMALQDSDIAQEISTAPIAIEQFGDVLDWFGPLCPEMLDLIMNTMHQRWFHGDVSTHEAEMKLEGRAKGTLLIHVNRQDLKRHQLNGRVWMGDRTESFEIVRDRIAKGYMFAFDAIEKEEESKKEPAEGAQEEVSMTRQRSGSIGGPGSSYPSLTAIIRHMRHKLQQEEDLIPCPGWPFASYFPNERRGSVSSHSAERVTLSSSPARYHLALQLQQQQQQNNTHSHTPATQKEEPTNTELITPLTVLEEDAQWQPSKPAVATKPRHQHMHLRTLSARKRDLHEELMRTSPKLAKRRMDSGGKPRDREHEEREKERYKAEKHEAREREREKERIEKEKDEGVDVEELERRRAQRAEERRRKEEEWKREEEERKKRREDRRKSIQSDDDVCGGGEKTII